MSENNNFDELISEALEEAASVKNRRMQILQEIGEKAIPEIRGNLNFAALIVMLEENEKQSNEIQENIIVLREEKERFEREEQERIAKLTCYYCKRVNKDSSRFCEECGAKLGEPPREYCTSCKTMNLPHMKYCGECGTKLAEIEQDHKII